MKLCDISMLTVLGIYNKVDYFIYAKICVKKSNELGNKKYVYENSCW